jgi:hypothetical protein
MWKAPAPQMGLEKWTTGEDNINFNVSNFVTYLAFLSLYSCPFILLSAKTIFEFFNSKRIFLLTGLIISFVYFVFPVAPSKVTLLQTEFETVGFFHRFLKSIIQNSFYEHLLLYFLFLIGLLVIIFIINDGVNKIIKREIDYTLFLDISIISFLIIMPFSYQVWEKYLLSLLLPFALRLILIKSIMKLKI